MQIPDVNLDAITDPVARQVIVQLLNVIEILYAEVVQLRAENQQLRDEINRLKGEQGTPDIKPPTPPPAPRNYSSEQERRAPKPRQKGRKAARLVPTRDEPCRIDPATLPPDAVRHGTRDLVIQDLRLVPDVIRFVREVWDVPSLGTTIIAPLPQGYQGAFGPHIRALTLALGHGANVSQPSLRTFFHDAGIQIGTGTLARWLRDHDGGWRDEAVAIHQAGLASTVWQATDQTPTRVDGQNAVCHVLGTALFTVYQTRRAGTRQDVLAVLWGQEPVFRLDDDALAWLVATPIRRGLLTALRQVLPWATDLTADDLAARLAATGVVLRAQQRQQIWDALAIAAYHAQTDVPIVRRLLSDDATVYHLLTDDHALCWVHDGRHYTKLTPVVPQHQALLAAFRTDYWTYYRRLVTYRAAPTADVQVRLRQDFDRLFARRTGYAALDERIATTQANRDLLLQVLDHPEIPLHNNDMELAARRRVRKRDVSFGPQSWAGAQAWDTFQTIIATATKLGVGVYHYFLNRLTQPATTPTLADHICEQMLITAAPSIV
jgi:hypothetical protein